MNLPSSLALFGYVQRKFGRKELARSQNRNHNEGWKSYVSLGPVKFSKHTLERRRQNRGRQRGAIYLSCQQFSGKWGGAALDLMRRASNSETTMPFEDQRTWQQPSVCLRGMGFWGRTWGRLSLFLSLFEGRLMKYPCQFNRVTSPVSHPKKRP